MNMYTFRHVKRCTNSLTKRMVKGLSQFSGNVPPVQITMLFVFIIRLSFGHL